MDPNRPVEAERRAHPRSEISTRAVLLARHNAGVEMQIVSISLGGARLIGEITLSLDERDEILFEI